MVTSTLKILRELNDYTQSHVAESVLGMSQAAYARLEQNPMKITLEQAKKLAALYHIDAHHLLSGDVPVIVFKEQTNNANHAHEELMKGLLATRDFLLQQNAALLELVGVMSTTKKGRLISRRPVKKNSNGTQG